MSTAIATLPANYNREKIELIKQTVAKGATDLELELFMHACQRTGLDPLMKQIYAIKRWSSADKRNVMSFQCGIDGYRLIADRTGLYAGSSDAIYEEAEGMPVMAQVTVLKVVGGEKCAFTASARWSEYVQKAQDGKPTSMWQKMPYLMLAKCAEALALRKAFPAELSGVYTHEEMMQAGEPEPERKPLKLPSEILAESERQQEVEGPDDTVPQNESLSKGDQKVRDAPAAPNAQFNDPAEPYRAKIKTAHDEKEVNAAYQATPETLKQDVYGTYTTKLKALGAKKK